MTLGDFKKSIVAGTWLEITKHGKHPERVGKLLRVTKITQDRFHGMLCETNGAFAGENTTNYWPPSRCIEIPNEQEFSLYYPYGADSYYAAFRIVESPHV